MMRRIAGLAAVVVFGSGIVGRADDAPGKFSGEWKTTMGPLALEQKGEKVTGKLVAWGLAVSGTAKGDELKASYDENGTHVDATLALAAGGASFSGPFTASNGNRGAWQGWRPDPAAAKATGKPGDFAGLWLTDLGLMALSRDGDKVRGRYALRGGSTLEGTARGRHLDFKVNAMRTGPGWFDLDEAGTTLSGAGGTDGMPSWYGWKGRKADEFAPHAPLVAGKVVDGSTDGLLTYCVRAPEDYKPGDGKKWPTVVLLHGSNMNGRAYVNTLASSRPDVAKKFLLLGINGELPSNTSSDGPAFNFTYVNYMGRSTYKGFPGTDRESPALVREAMDELRKVYPIDHYLVGGHSQGAFLTYCLLMHSPEALAGAFPVSGGLVMQAEPSAFDDKALMAAQRKIPLAIVHGRNDPVVGFDSGNYAFGRFLDAGWPAVRLVTDDRAGHMFGLLPVGDAVLWLEAMASSDPKVLLDLAQQRLDAKAPRDAVAALRRARTFKPDGPLRERADRIAKAIDAAASAPAKKYIAAIKANKDGSWVDGFLTFRDSYEFADAAAPAMAAFDALRAEHEPKATEAMNAARVAFRQGKRDDGYARAREVVEKFYASSSYRTAKQWLAEKN